MKKAIIIGAPFTGKSTLVNIFRKQFPNLCIKELDEMLIKMNEGTWPSDPELRKNLLSEAIRKILKRKDDILFFTSYISFTHIRKAQQAGFIIIQLSCSRETLVSRNVNQEDNRLAEMDRNLEYQKKLRELNLVDKIIDCSQNITEVMKEIINGT